MQHTLFAVWLTRCFARSLAVCWSRWFFVFAGLAGSLLLRSVAALTLGRCFPGRSVAALARSLLHLSLCRCFAGRSLGRSLGRCFAAFCARLLLARHSACNARSSLALTGARSVRCSFHVRSPLPRASPLLRSSARSHLCCSSAAPLRATAALASLSAWVGGRRCMRGGLGGLGAHAHTGGRCVCARARGAGGTGDPRWGARGGTRGGQSAVCSLSA